MGKIIASYLVKVTLREPEHQEGCSIAFASDGTTGEGICDCGAITGRLVIPTNDDLINEIGARLTVALGGYRVSASSERTDS
jgi:hypothetical protein